MYDQDKDTYSNQLMEKIEAHDSLSEQLRSLQREFNEINHKYNDLVSNSHGVEKQLIGREDQLNRVYSDNQQLKDECSRLKSDLDFKHKEAAELNQDIKVLINENQKLNEIHSDLLNKLAASNDDLQRLKDEGRSTDNVLRTRESQVDDVMTMYKRVCDENEKLNSMSENAIDEKHQLEG